MANHLRITWGAPDPDRGPESPTFMTVTVSDPEQLDTVFSDDSLPELPKEPEPTSEGGMEPTDAPPPVVADRYERRHPLGSGGMGEVWRVFDRTLRRTVALKVIRSQLTARELLARFEEEAQVTAQLQHPGIIPVHDYGQLDDGRVWFTMREVQGRTLEDLLQEVHRAWRMGLDATESGFTFRRMLEGFLRVVETMAYSHSRGVVHRDLKPSNIMFGPYGEVLVLDWGLAKLVGSLDAAGGEVSPVVLGADQARQTQLGAITGTPAYMSPEQAQGDSYSAGPPADVYSLGATLYDVLCERPPRLAQTPKKLVLQVALGTTFPRPREVSDGPPLDEELERICLKALRTEIDERYGDAGEMAADFAQWLDDARKREQAMAFVNASKRKMRASERAARQAEAKRAEAAAALEDVAENAPVPDKLAGWALEDHAVDLEEQARTARTEAVQDLRSALSHAPDFTTAHDLLADHFHGIHLELEQSGQGAAARQVARELALHDRSGRYGGYLTGTGALSLVTNPEGVEVRLHEYVLDERRLKPRYVRSLGHTPLVELPLEMGSYLLTLHKQGHEVVRYPVFIRRQEHWHGVPPDASEPRAIWMPRRGEVREGETYVPAGWFWWGDDSFPGLPPFERRWTDGFTMGTFPVTVGDYAAWLNELWMTERRDEAEAHQPRLMDADVPVLRRLDDGRFGTMVNDRPGWEAVPPGEKAPAILVGVAHAEAYALHHGARLPSGQEWVHAARGADRRAYPWGDAFDPTWCRMRATDAILRVVDVGHHPEDCSPYGVRDLAGNVSDWVRGDVGWERRGGSISNGRESCRIAVGTPENRWEQSRYPTNALRLVRALSASWRR